jgi:outer membrane protein TolC
MNDMKREVQKGVLAACGVAVWMAAGCASVKPDKQPAASAGGTPAPANTAAVATNAPPAEGYAWDVLARMAAANCSEAKALLLEAAAERHQTAVDTGWRNPQLRVGDHWGNEDETKRNSPYGRSREWGDSSFDGNTAALRLYTSNPFVNRWLRKRGSAAARALEEESKETAYTVFCEVRALCLDAETARGELDLLEQMAGLRTQARDFRKAQAESKVADALALIRAETQLAALRYEIREKQTARQQVLRRIAVLTGLPVEQLRLRPPDFERRMRPECLNRAALTDLAFVRRPDLMRVQYEKEAAEHKVKAAEAGQIPWFEYVEGTFEQEDRISNSYEMDVSGHDASYREESEWQMRVAMTLPVFNWLGDEVKLSRTHLAAAKAREAGLYETICAEVSGVLEDYQAARAERERLADEYRRLQGSMTAKIDALANEAAVKREDVLAAREELISYQRICLKAERECLRMQQYLETVSGGALTQDK